MHKQKLKEILANETIAVALDETQDDRDYSVLNIVVMLRSVAYVIDVKFMNACNHATVSHAVIDCLKDFGIEFENVMAFSTDSAAYCKKAVRLVLMPLFPNAIHVPDLPHILNLVGEILRLWKPFDKLASFVRVFRSAMHRQAARKRRYLIHLKRVKPSGHRKCPPEPVTSRWDSCYQAVEYHSRYLEFYEEFFAAEPNQGVAVERVLEMLRDRKTFDQLQLFASFVAETGRRTVTTLQALECTTKVTKPLAAMVFDFVEDFRRYLTSGCSAVSFGEQTDQQIAEYGDDDQIRILRCFNGVFEKQLEMFHVHWDDHPAKNHYRLARVFDPRKLPLVSKTIEDYTSLFGLEAPDCDLLHEWLIYTQYKVDDVPQDFGFRKEMFFQHWPKWLGGQFGCPLGVFQWKFLSANINICWMRDVTE